MNKLTKLLSVFVLAGTVGAGAAALAGCNTNDTPPDDGAHTHSVTKHDAVAATCTQDGSVEYYTCSGEDCAGKYYSDEACTTELTAEQLVAPKLGHSLTKTVDNKDGTHSTACVNCDYVSEEKTAHTTSVKDNGNGTHSTVCADCDYEVKEDHKLESKDNEDGTHTTSCEVCGYEATENHHTSAAATDNKDGTHSFVCDECGNAAKEDHKLESKDNEDGTHTTSCTVCDYSVTHNNVYTNTSYLQHTVSCGGETPCDFTALVDHKDADGDGKCDDCEANVAAFKSGSYVCRLWVDAPFEIDATSGTIEFRNQTITLSAVDKDGVATFIDTGDDNREYNISMSGENYTLTRIFKDASGNVTSRNLYTYIPEPDIYVTQNSDFKGVYKPESDALVYKRNSYYYKLLNIMVYENGDVLYEVVMVDNADGTTDEGHTYQPIYTSEMLNDLAYNRTSITGVSIYLTALNEGAATVSVYHYADTEKVVNYVRDTSAELFVVPEKLPIANDETYAGDGYTLTSTNGNYNLNDNSVTLIDQKTVDGNTVVLIRTINSSNDPVNYYLTFVTAEDGSITIKISDMLENELSTLTKYVYQRSEFVADGTTENQGKVEGAYGYFIVPETGYYVFTVYTSMARIYTEMKADGTPDTKKELAKTNNAAWTEFTTDVVYLEKGVTIAITTEDYVNSYPFVATYSETNPDDEEPVYVECTMEGSSYTISSFASTQLYRVKKTVPANGTYIVSLSNTAFTDRGPCFTINGTDYGYSYDSSQWKFLPQAAGLVCNDIFAENDELFIVISVDNEASFMNFGDVTVNFETPAEYMKRVNSPAEDGNIYGKIGANTLQADSSNKISVTLNPGSYKVTYSDGNILTIYNGETLVNSSDTITVRDNPVTITINVGNSFTATTFTLADNWVLKAGTGSSATESVKLEGGLVNTYTLAASAGSIYKFTFAESVTVEYDSKTYTSEFYTDRFMEKTTIALKVTAAESGTYAFTVVTSRVSAGENKLTFPASGSISATFTATGGKLYKLTFDESKIVVKVDDVQISSGDYIDNTSASSSKTYKITVENLSDTAEHTLTIESKEIANGTTTLTLAANASEKFALVTYGNSSSAKFKFIFDATKISVRNGETAITSGEDISVSSGDLITVTNLTDAEVSADLLISLQKEITAASGNTGAIYKGTYLIFKGDAGRTVTYTVAQYQTYNPFPTLKLVNEDGTYGEEITSADALGEIVLQGEQTVTYFIVGWTGTSSYTQLKITKTDNGEYEEPKTELTLGESTTITITDAANGAECVFTATEAGKYAFYFDAVTADRYGIVVVDKANPNVPLSSGEPIELAAEGTVTLVCYIGTPPSDFYTGSFSLTVAAYSEPVLNVGDNTVTVTSDAAWDGVNYTFTAETAGKYTITYDATGYVMVDSNGVTEQLASGTVLELTEGQEVTLNCTMSDTSAGSFTITITKA